ncbi:MRN complex-interacting protein isoform X2 [Parambassis ranga]|uniref:MRN complex-interacting protein isoform X2 n=1 Tax=Parambassis ranga TaxID=210632 RepID=A0A6P7J5H7_9TELE|nr:MRN complex-interacting protein isoform X2 [Parambassis ranga]
MVQEFHVVRCFTCQSFQVQQEFGRGSGADCRRHVQKLNAMRGAMLEEQERNTWVLREEEKQRADPLKQPQVSRWSKYLDTPALLEPEEIVLKDRQQRHGDSIRDRKRKRSKDQTDSWLEDSPEQPNIVKAHPAFLELCSASCSPLEGEGPSASTNGATAPPVPDTVPDTVPRPRALLPVSSMFMSGEEFNFDDDDFLTEQRM